MLWVHSSCIACDHCVKLAPDYFSMASDYLSVQVTQQPVIPRDIALCDRAKATCPVQAIRHA